MANGGVVQGSQGGRLYQWNAVVNAYNIAETDTTYTIRCDVGYYTRWAISVNAEASMWGAASGSWSGKMTGSNSGNGTVAVITRDVTVRKNGSAQDVGFGGGFRVTGGFGSGYSAAESHVTVPAIVYLAPHQPKGFSAWRSSDKSMGMKWTGDYTGGDGQYPWSGIQIERSANGGSWTRVANLGWSATSWTDTGTWENARFQYRIRSVNSAGSSGWQYSGYLYTTPGTPSSVTLSRSGDRGVNAAVSVSAPYADGYEAQRSTDGGKTWASFSSTITPALPASKFTVKDASAPAGSVMYRVRMKSHGIAGAWRSSGSTNIALKPNPVTGVTASRASDSRVNLTWANHATSVADLRPYSGIKVERQTDGGSWTTIATLGASVANYADTGVQANRRYQYRVHPYNSWGNGDNASSGYVYTTPAAPSSVSLAKQGAQKVSLTVNGSVPWATSIEAQLTTDGGVTWKAATVSTSGSSPKWTLTDDDAPAGTVTYRVRMARGDLKSAWKQTGSVTTITPPSAPDVYGLSAVYSTEEEISVSWMPSHPDGSGQTSAQVELTLGDGTPQSFDVSGDQASYALGKLAKGSYSVRVRTKGLHADWGAWSAKSTFRVAVAPSASFTYPSQDGEVVDTLPLPVTWDVDDETGVASQTLELYSADGYMLHIASLAVDARSYPFGHATYSLENTSSYRLVLSVRAGSGLTGRFERSFSTGWADPASPLGTMSYEDGSAMLFIIDGTGEDLPPATRFTVTRRMPDGSLTAIGGDYTDGQTATDVLPPLNTDYEYLLRAYAESGVFAETVVPARVDTGGFEAFNFGADASACVMLGFDATGEESAAHSGEWFHFALGSTAPSLPTFYQDGDMDVSGRHSYVLIDRAEYDRLRTEVRKPLNASCWYRDAWGHRAYVKADWSLSYDADAYMRFDVSVDVTEAVWEEPYDA